jgi:hypothetical protein
MYTLKLSIYDNNRKPHEQNGADWDSTIKVSVIYPHPAHEKMSKPKLREQN